MFEKHVKKAISKIIGGKDLNLEVPPDQKLGDLAFPCFSLAKKKKESPVEIAKEIAKRIKPDKRIKQARATGPYVNIFLKKDALAEDILPAVLKSRKMYGKSKKQKNKIVIEYPGPNTNKPLHLGHLRNMCLGHSLNKILASQGNKTIPVNINNDRGIHICKSMLAYKKWGRGSTPESANMKSDFFVGKYYVMFNKKAKENPKLEQEARNLLQKWEEGDKDTLALWKKMNKWAFKGFKQTYRKFGISFEKEYYESNLYKKGKKIVKEGLKKEVFTKDRKGAIYIDLTEEGYDKKVVLRADGTSLYITQDLYLAKKRYDEFRFDKMIYVVANEQNYHFKILFMVLDKLGYKFSDKCHHFSYGMVNLTIGRMKSREGTVVDADTLLAELEVLAEKEIKKRHPELKKEKISKRAKKVAMSALRFHMLKYDPLKNFTFNPKESISFEGETGPYIQYTCARINSIIRKSKESPDKAELSLLKRSQEKKIIKKLSEFPKILDKVSSNYKISSLSHYLLSLSQDFNTYYHKTKVIQKDKELEKSRLSLITAIKQVLENGLELLGIESLEEM